MPARKKRKRLTDEQREEAARNFPLAVKIATGMGYHGMPMDDQIQEGAIGLCDYARIKFDPKRGLQKSTLAAKCIKNQVLNSRRGCDLIRIPAWLQEKAGADHPFQRHANAVRDRVGIDEAMEHGDHPIEPEDDESEFGHQAIRAVRRAVQKLPPLERDVIRGLIFRGEQPGALCRKHGVSYHVVKRAKARAMAKLRTSLSRHV